MTVIFNDTLNAYGGSHTLMLRMCKWLRLHDINTGVFCISDTNEEIVAELKKIGVFIKKVGSFDLKRLKTSFIECSGLDQNFLVINFTLEKWLNVEVLKKGLNGIIENVIYDIHFATFHKGQSLSNKFLRNYIIKKTRRIVLKLYDNNAIFSMDITNIDSARNYLNLGQNYKPEILPLPMFCKRKSNYLTCIKNGFDSNIIMAAARAEFPFKGYLLGLVDDFILLRKKYPELKLCVVSAGENFDQLKEKIDLLPKEIKKDINIKGWMPYPKLIALMQKCKFFVGMGTTVLDAALQYKPVLISAFNTNENKTIGLFSDNPFVLGPEEKDSKKAGQYMDSICSLNFKRYEAVCNISFETVFQNYNIDKIMPLFLDRRNKNVKCILSQKEIFMHKLHMAINKIRYKDKIYKDYFGDVKNVNF